MFKFPSKSYSSFLSKSNISNLLKNVLKVKKIVFKFWRSCWAMYPRSVSSSANGMHASPSTSFFLSFSDPLYAMLFSFSFSKSLTLFVPVPVLFAWTYTRRERERELSDKNTTTVPNIQTSKWKCLMGERHFTLENGGIYYLNITLRCNVWSIFSPSNIRFNTLFPTKNTLF